MKESDIIKKIKAIHGKENVIRFTPGPYSPAGIPDLYIIDPENPVNNFWVEIKYNGLKPTANQERFMRSVCGCFLYIKENGSVNYCENKFNGSQYKIMDTIIRGKKL